VGRLLFEGVSDGRRHNMQANKSRDTAPEIMVRRHGARFGVFPAESNGRSESFVKTQKRDHARLAVLPDAGAILANLPGWFEELL
jgi:hypothetical protein